MGTCRECYVMKKVTMDHMQELDIFGGPPQNCVQQSAGASARDNTEQKNKKGH